MKPWLWVVLLVAPLSIVAAAMVALEGRFTVTHLTVLILTSGLIATTVFLTERYLNREGPGGRFGRSLKVIKWGMVVYFAAGILGLAVKLIHGLVTRS